MNDLESRSAQTLDPHPEPVVYIVDDEDMPRRSVSVLVESVGLKAKAYPSAEDFIADYQDEGVGCLVVDIRMPGMNGLELLEHLRDQDISLPTVVITGYARTRTTVKAMKLGAVTLLEKIYEEDDLLDAIRAGIRTHEKQREEQKEIRSIEARLQQLTPKENTVLQCMIKGDANKNIANELEVSLRTVEARRQAIFQKAEANSLAELVTMVMKLKNYRARNPETES